MTAPAGAGLPEPVPRNGGTQVATPPSDPQNLPTAGIELPAQPGLSHSLRGHYAGFASRFLAFVADCVVSIAVFELILAACSFAASVLTGSSIHWNRGSLWVVISFFVWEFLYYANSWTSSGKTPGMWLLGVQVVGQDGSNVGAKRGLVRTLAFPLSFILLGLGFLGILLGRDRRALHDVIADTAVVYTWSAREARLRSLARRRGGQPQKQQTGSGASSPAPQVEFTSAGTSPATIDGAASPSRAVTAQSGTPDTPSTSNAPNTADQ